MASSSASARTTPYPAYTAYTAYAAALFFALHLAIYFVPSIRDASISSSLVVALALAILAVARHLVVFPSSSPRLCAQRAGVGEGRRVRLVARGHGD
jgi:hypothetical protein